MANEKEDEFALVKPNGLPAYPKMVYTPTGEKHPNGAPVMDAGRIVNNPDEHKSYLSEKSGNKKAAWDK